jgi:hypothetical protein
MNKVIVINGFRVTAGSHSGNAVRYGAWLLSENPGMQTGVFSDEVCKFTGLLNRLNKWLIEPAKVSPVGLLWSLGGRNNTRLYLLPGTEVLVGTHITRAEVEYYKSERTMKSRNLLVGSLVRHYDELGYIVGPHDSERINILYRGEPCLAYFNNLFSD